MDKEKLKNMAKDKKYISGIYNYCDRWCERCPQTSRCLNYAMGEEEFSDPETRDINNEAYWKKMSEIMKTTLEMLNDMIISAGLDPEELYDEEDFEEQTIKETAENHVVCRMAREYIDMAEEWFDEIKELLTDPVHDLSAGEKYNPETESDNDYVDILRWYQPQIYVKLMRAVSGLLEESDSFDNGDYASDSDGSAKVALIGIDRSIAAWGNMNTLFPVFHDNDIKNILIHLDRLRVNVEKTFPNAREFVRPGFDHVDLNG